MTSIRQKTVWFCSSCGNESPKWMGRCPACGEWNTMVEEKVAVGKPSGAARQQGFHVPGSGQKPVPLSEEEIAMLGNKEQEVVFSFDVGDTVVVTSGAWKDTVGAIRSINPSKHSVTINVEMFGRETPVELSFAEVKKL